MISKELTEAFEELSEDEIILAKNLSEETAEAISNGIYDEKVLEDVFGSIFYMYGLTEKNWPEIVTGINEFVDDYWIDEDGDDYFSIFESKKSKKKSKSKSKAAKKEEPKAEPAKAEPAKVEPKEPAKVEPKEPPRVEPKEPAKVEPATPAAKKKGAIGRALSWIGREALKHAEKRLASTATEKGTAKHTLVHAARGAIKQYQHGKGTGKEIIKKSAKQLAVKGAKGLVRKGLKMVFGTWRKTNPKGTKKESLDERNIVPKSLRTPILGGLIASGHIKVDKGEYVGIASDGKEVNIGWVGDEVRAERYLKAHPSPSDW